MYMTLKLIGDWARYDRRDVHHYINAIDPGTILLDEHWINWVVRCYIDHVVRCPGETALDVALMNMPLIAWHFGLLEQQQQVTLLCCARRSAVAQALLSHLTEAAATAVLTSARAIIMDDAEDEGSGCVLSLLEVKAQPSSSN